MNELRMKWANENFVMCVILTKMEIDVWRHGPSSLKFNTEWGYNEPQIPLLIGKVNHPISKWTERDNENRNPTLLSLSFIYFWVAYTDPNLSIEIIIAL